MKSVKKFLSVCLAVLFLAGTAAVAQAKSYTVADGDVEILANIDGQTVAAGAPRTTGADRSPVISGESDTYFVEVDAYDGVTARLTVSDLAIRSRAASTLNLWLDDSSVDLILWGDNSLTGTNAIGQDGLFIAGTDPETSSVSIQGPGSLSASIGQGANGAAVYVDYAALSVDGGDLTAIGPSGHGIGLYNGSTLTVSEDYLHPASVTVIGGQGSFDIDAASQVVIGENNFVFDENGRDITAQVLANPDLLKTMKYVIISTKDIAVFPSDDMESNVHLMTAYKNTKFVQTGEPSGEAMSALSQGMNGEALYAGSFAFTDDIQSHGKFQLNIMLPQYAGRHVKLATLDHGSAVVYDRWVGNDGLVWAHIDHLGDFAVFAA